jgi:adenylate cyclase
VTDQRVERRLAAVLAADVAGYSRLMGADEVGTLQALKAHRRELIDPSIAAFKGRIVKTTGDGMLVEFPSAVDAVTCAIAVQAKMLERNASAAQKITFRIGINIGDIIIDGDDIFGDGVNIAARVENECEPGGVLLSGNAFDQIRGKTAFFFDDLGERSLKNIERQVRLYAVRSAGDAAGDIEVSTKPQPPQQRGSTALPLPDKPSIAVLPFTNMSGDPEQEYFADGMVEDVITELSRFKSLFVIARNSSFTYKGKAVDVKRVGQELGVRYVLEGSVRKSGERVRITGQLIDASSGAHLWADKFDGLLADVFGLQDDVTQKVVASIAPTMERAEIERANRKQTERLDSYDFFLRGIALANRRRSASTIEEAYHAFKKAAELDATYAAAHVMVAYSGLVYQAHTGVRLPAARLEEALRFADAARTLGEGDAFVEARAGHVLAYLGRQHDLALSLVNQAVKLNSNLAPAWYSRGAVCVMCAKPQDAIQSFKYLRRLSPRDPLLVNASYMTGWAHFIAKEYSEGCEAAQEAVQSAPDAHSLAAFAANAIRAGREAEAMQAAEQLLRFQPGFSASHAHHLYPIRAVEVDDRIQAALRDAGIPE